MRAQILAAAESALNAALGIDVGTANGYVRNDVDHGPVVEVDIPTEVVSEDSEMLALGSSVGVDATLTVAVAYSITETRSDIESVLETAHKALANSENLAGAVESISYAGFDIAPPDDDGDAAVATHTYIVGYTR